MARQVESGVLEHFGMNVARPFARFVKSAFQGMV